MLNFTEDELQKSRTTATTEERVVLALESIADQLRLFLTPSVNNSGHTAHEFRDTWENEEGSLHLPPIYASEIECRLVTQYAVGPFRYEKLADAVAQARRVREAVEQGSGAN